MILKAIIIQIYIKIQLFYLGLRGKHLDDGIFARVESGPESPFITPICYLNRELTLKENM